MRPPTSADRPTRTGSLAPAKAPANSRCRRKADEWVTTLLPGHDVGSCWEPGGNLPRGLRFRQTVLRDSVGYFTVRMQSDLMGRSNTRAVAIRGYPRDKAGALIARMTSGASATSSAGSCLPALSAVDTFTSANISSFAKGAFGEHRRQGTEGMKLEIEAPTPINSLGPAGSVPLSSQNASPPAAHKAHKRLFISP